MSPMSDNNPQTPLPTLSLAKINAALVALPTFTPTVLRSSLSWLRDTLHPLHRLEEEYTTDTSGALGGEDPEDYRCTLEESKDRGVGATVGVTAEEGFEIDEDIDAMNSKAGKMGVPALKKERWGKHVGGPYSTSARVQGDGQGSRDGRSEEQRKENVDVRRQYREDRRRVRQVKKILEMGQSSLLMPPAGSQYQGRDQRGGSRGGRLRGLGEDYVLAGGSLVVPSKTKLDESEKEAVARRLQEAMESNAFKVWPNFQDNRPMPEGARTERKESPEFRDVGAWRKEAAKEMWDKKEERSLEGRRRVAGGYEDMIEAEKLLDNAMFGATL
ncbi:uncharacterized protein L3040_008294 [Drepanopeziza brunnea f. sp. 'multigermtubi']|uniref:uncharacterized protein n=1 Tax=Drepanopeziza brunnea f. sp. 'multigermtubi' TaxID=698441 RepID=UPI002387E7D9|nr:hypothetical protein L3040_008294 [Drepanopeziza brunnea f. sp. 'multigermtubi']